MSCTTPLVGGVVPRVLVVEDDECWQRAYPVMLANAGADCVAVVATVEAAYNFLQRHAVDAVLLDYDLGNGRTGEEVAASLVASGWSTRRLLSFTGSALETLPPLSYRVVTKTAAAAHITLWTGELMAGLARACR